MNRRILVAGIGNIFLGDDAFGVEVIRELMLRPVPEEVCVKDFGIRGYDLAYAIMDGYEATILVDAAPRGQPPGTLYLIEPDLERIEGPGNVDAHSMNPMAVLQLIHALGGRPGKLYLVGCEPGVLETDEICLSPNVRAAVPQAVKMIESLVRRLLNENQTAIALTGA
ncbi:MAG TPA: hydrogenase maturation protease [Terrimicrobium sp.]